MFQRPFQPCRVNALAVCRTLGSLANPLLNYYKEAGFSAITVREVVVHCFVMLIGRGTWKFTELPANPGKFLACSRVFPLKYRILDAIPKGGCALVWLVLCTLKSLLRWVYGFDLLGLEVGMRSTGQWCKLGGDLGRPGVRIQF